MPDLWYCSLKSGVWGPAPKSEVEKILKDGYLNKKTWVRKKEDADWVALEDAGLFALEEIPEPKPVAEKKESAPTESEPVEEKTQSEKKSTPPPPLPEEEDEPLPQKETEDAFKTEVMDIAAEATQKSKEALVALGGKGQQALEAMDIEEKKKKAKATFNLYRLFWTRVLKSDFSVIESTEDEAKKLESGTEKVESPLAQDYASWRRSMLMICILVLFFSTLFNISDILLTLGQQDVHVVKKIQTVLIFFFQLGSVLLCAVAARKWVDLRKSRSLARFAWLLQFVGPFLIFLIPLSLFVDDRRILAQLGLGAVLVLAPKIFGLFPGLIRCSLTVKTLLPETSTPGWLGIIIAPTYSLSRHGHHHCDSDIRVHHGHRLCALGHKHGHRNPEGSIASQGNRPKGCLRHRERNQEEANVFSSGRRRLHRRIRFPASRKRRFERDQQPLPFRLFLHRQRHLADRGDVRLHAGHDQARPIASGRLCRNASGEITQPKVG